MAKPGPKPKPKLNKPTGASTTASTHNCFTSTSTSNARQPVIVKFPTSDHLQDIQREVEDVEDDAGGVQKKLLSLRDSPPAVAPIAPPPPPTTTLGGGKATTTTTTKTTTTAGGGKTGKSGSKVVKGKMGLGLGLGGGGGAGGDVGAGAGAAGAGGAADAAVVGESSRVAVERAGTPVSMNDTVVVGNLEPSSITTTAIPTATATPTTTTTTTATPSQPTPTPPPKPSTADPPHPSLPLPLAPHKIKLIQSNCSLFIGPIKVSGVSVWECRWDRDDEEGRGGGGVAVGVGVGVAGRGKVGGGDVLDKGLGDKAQARATNPPNLTTPNAPIVPPTPTPVVTPISTVNPTTIPSSSKLPSVPPLARPAESGSTGVGTTGLQNQGKDGVRVDVSGPSNTAIPEGAGKVTGPGAAHGGLAPGPPITRELIDLVNLKARSHPWLQSLIHRAANKLASMSELKRLGGVVEILNGGWDLPDHLALAERAAGDAAGYLRSGPRRLVVNGIVLGVAGLPLKPQPSARPPAKSSTNASKKASTVVPRTPASAPSTLPTGPTAPTPEYPLILISFAENPALKFVLPVPLAYMSYTPANTPAPQPTSTSSQSHGRVLCSTFLPSRGWGRWEPENATSTDQARKRRRKDHSAHARLGLPKDDKEFMIGGCTVPPGPVEPLTIKFEGVLDSTWKALSRVAKEVEDCLEERRRKQEVERVKEVERIKARKIALEKAEEVEVEKKRKEEEEKDKVKEKEKETKDGDVEMEKIAPDNSGPAEVGSNAVPLSTELVEDDMIVVQPKEVVKEPSPKRPKRESKKKRWSDGEEETIKPSVSSRPKASGPVKNVELEEEEVVVAGDDLSKSFKARIFNQLLKRVPPRRYLKLRLAAPLPEDLVKAGTHISDPVIKDLTLSKAAGAGQGTITAQRKRPRATISIPSGTKRSTGPRSKKVKIDPAIVDDQVVSDLPASNATLPIVELTEKEAAVGVVSV